MNADDDEPPVLDTRLPCQLWHFVGVYVVSPTQVTPNTIAVVGVRDHAAKRMVAQQLVAVIEASKAINRMMGRPDFYGMNKPPKGAQQ